MAAVIDSRHPSPFISTPPQSSPNDIRYSTPDQSQPSSYTPTSLPYSSPITPRLLPPSSPARSSSPYSPPPPLVWATSSRYPYESPPSLSAAPPMGKAPLWEDSKLEAQPVPPSPSFTSFDSDRDEHSSDSASDGDSDTRSSSSSSSSELSELEKELLQVRSPPRLKKERILLPSNRPTQARSESSSTSNHRSKALSSSPSYRVAKSRSRWSADEGVTIRHLREEKHLQWAEVAKLMPGRSSLACNRYYNKTKLAAKRSAAISSSDGQMAETSTITTAKTSRWKLEEIQKLREMRAAGGSWKYVAEQMPGRTVGACRRKRELTRVEVEANILASLEGGIEDEEDDEGKGEEVGTIEQLGESEDLEMSDDPMIEDRYERGIVKANSRSTDPIPSNEDELDIDVKDRRPESGVEEEEKEEKEDAFEFAVESDFEGVEESIVADSSTSSGDESSQNDFDDEATRRGMHDFYKNR